MSSKILVATHKSYQFPSEEFYTPIHVGAAQGKSDFGYLRDDKSENISLKNDSFCELTALYWAWKNNYFNDQDQVGLVHYRRYFKGDLSFGKFGILGEHQIEILLASNDIIVPKKRNYYIQSIYSHYSHAHYVEDLEKLRETISKVSPSYLYAFEALMKQRSLHLYNMFVMPYEHFEGYCEWLFQLLFTLEEKIDISKRSTYQKRVFGFLAERLFNVWILHHQYRVFEVDVVNIEGENLFKKGWDMIGRMLSGKRRES